MLSDEGTCSLRKLHCGKAFLYVFYIFIVYLLLRSRTRSQALRRNYGFTSNHGSLILHLRSPFIPLNASL